MRAAIFTTFCFCGLVTSAAAQSPKATKPDSEKGTYLGVLFSPIPEALRAQLPVLPKTGGAIITHVLPKSPAEKVGMQRYDVLLKYNEKPIRDCTHFAELIRADRPGSVVKLSLVRQGKAANAKVSLELGPVLVVAPRGEARDGGGNAHPPGTAKPGGPDQISVSAVPMEGNRMQVTFEFYHKGTGKFKSVTCSGAPEQIDEQIEKRLPKTVQSMANYAVDHLRKLRFQQKQLPESKPTPKSH